MGTLELQAITGAYSRNQGLMQISIQMKDLVHVEKKNLHPQGIHPWGIMITVLPHRYTHYLPWDQAIFNSLMELAMHNAEHQGVQP